MHVKHLQITMLNQVCLTVKIFEAIEALIYVAEHDLDGFVRREAERCASIMREWINEWSSKPPILDIKIRKE